MLITELRLPAGARKAEFIIATFKKRRHGTPLARLQRSLALFNVDSGVIVPGTLRPVVPAKQLFLRNRRMRKSYKL